MMASTPKKSNSASRIQRSQNRNDYPSDSDCSAPYHARDDDDDSGIDPTSSNPLHPVEEGCSNQTITHQQHTMTQEDHGAEEEEEHQLPLTWNESRSRLRITLEHWNSECKRDKQLLGSKNPVNNTNTSKNGWISMLISVDDPDMLFLAIPTSLLFVVLSFVLPGGDSKMSSSSSSSSVFPKMQQAAALLFLMSAISSAWITRRRRNVSRDTDRSIKRSRCVSAFLEGMANRHLAQPTFGIPLQSTPTTQQQQPQQQPSVSTPSNLFNVDTIPRKNVEDVYSTYRLINHECSADGHGYWHRIPSLLLVKGDFIALKVGDTAPAKCTVVKPFHNGEGSGACDENATISIIEAGERLTVNSLSPLVRDTLGSPSADNRKAAKSSIAKEDTAPTFNATSKSNATSKQNASKNKKGLLPPGRSTLKHHSEEMLMLANGVQIFALLETPLGSFLRKEGAKKQVTPPQIIRQVEAIRTILLQFAIVVFLCTLFILLVRPQGAQNFFKHPTWSLPLLAALGVLPVATPIFLFWVECIGTSRILATVHPLASYQRQQKHEPNGVLDYSRQISVLSLDEHSLSETRGMESPSPWLLCRYLMATSSSRLLTFETKHSLSSHDALLSIPPASWHLLEKLGVVTALALVDDQLACEPFSTPQQLLIPSGKGGFTLLDICPAFDGDLYSAGDDDNENKNNSSLRSTNNRQSSENISIDSDESNVEARFNHSLTAPARTLRNIRKSYSMKKYVSGRRLRGSAHQETCQQYGVTRGTGDNEYDVEVQFEDPNWWKHLPSLKCIGLGCLLVEEGTKTKAKRTSRRVSFKPIRPQGVKASPLLTPVQTSLIDHICCDKRRKQLQLLAQCIGFDTNPNALGPRGDLSNFHERRRLHILSTNLLRQRIQLDSHALGLEESRNWSLLSTDADTVFVRDQRSGGDLVLTVGDARVVTQLCPELWQGENSTISPLTNDDRQIINETQKNWMLSDLDVQAFSYAPLPYTASQKIESDILKYPDDSHIYLLDNTITPNAHIPSNGYWGIVKSQVFLGLLGSSVRPRKEIEPLVQSCADAGVRFVYFSPRNMRRTKELAKQMGIEVSWNCAISLRPLEEGADDSFRMASNYADWDVNARLPHGVDDVRRHLEEVDNVPLLVSLYTDATKDKAADMVSVFQEYNDTVLSVGLSHVPRNQDIFSQADISIGVDVLAEDVLFDNTDSGNHEWNALQPDEIAFVTSISAHSSVFNLAGSHATCFFIEIIRIGRASLEAATSGISFALSGCLSFSIFILLCPCTAATAVPTISALPAFLYTQVLLPLIGLSMVLSEEAKGFMTEVPPKNDPSSVKYSLRANKRMYLSTLLKATIPAIMPHLLYLIVLGELMWEFDSPFVEKFCLGDGVHNHGKAPISSIIRCEALREYSGPAKESAGTITLAALALCTCVTSASYVFRTESILFEYPWKRNHLWFGNLALSIILIAVYMASTLEEGSMSALPWYFYILFLVTPFICLYSCELVKKIDQKHEKRSVMMRRLQFETRLGMWSPKENTHIHNPASPMV